MFGFTYYFYNVFSFKKGKGEICNYKINCFK